MLSFVLPGQTANPRQAIEQARDAERIGHCGIVVSERWESKESASVLGALAATTDRVTLVAGMTHFTTRHPLVQAGMAQTLQMLSDDRFVLGYGRGVPSHFPSLGIRVLDHHGMADHVKIIRKLWAGETVRYHGPAGDYPEMQLAMGYERPPPIIIGAITPESLRLGGGHFDGVALHPFLTVEGAARSITLVKDAARAAGRDPDAIRIYASVVTAPDTLPPDQRMDMVEARAVSYFMHSAIGGALVAANGWDSDPVRRLVEAGLAKLEFEQGTILSKRARLAAASDLVPPAWIADAAALGSPAQCVERLQEYRDAGVHHIILHGSTPAQQAVLFDVLEESEKKERTS
ncbi:TIGR03857 family LLM class F420-dependent oxidoreductase [Novosphingobium colocasiae]|uniref:TIGR03857 family LLM class F420-dependent oxidoreductase n=1 Tax=Novosphingobium colocasiae TaxID=1256513 RepID=UPI0035AE70E4